MNELSSVIRKRIKLTQEFFLRQGLLIEDFMSKEGYPEPNFYTRLLGIRASWNRNDQQRLEEALKGTRHHRNARGFKEFAANLLLGWLYQDFLLRLLRQSHLAVTRWGTDATRELLTGGEVSEEADLRILAQDTWYLDVITDYPTTRNKPSFWKDTMRCHLRNKKLPRLLEVVKEGSRAGVIGIIIQLDEYFFQEVAQGTESKYIETHWAYGGKPAWELNLRHLGVVFNSLADFPKCLPFY